MSRGSASSKIPKRVGRYEVVREIGTGAMGRVLLARDPVLERHVAVKLLRDDLSIGSDVRDGLLVRMRHEARAAARVTHPHLVVLHDMGEDEDVGLFLVFEYLEGPTLKQRIADGRLSARQAARLARELGSALTFAHERGVLHRDVKPENIILSPTGAKITDFGIARVPDSTLTHAGGLLGTPAYSAPETFRDGKFSPASDQFSLAATLYEAIRGERAFPGDDAVSVASKIANDPPAPFAADLRYPEELDAILSRGMAKSAADRFPSCKEFGQALLDALLANPTAGRSIPAGERASDTLVAARLSATPDRPSIPPAPPRPVRVFLGGVAVLVVSGLVVRSALRDTREAPAAPLVEPSAERSAAAPASAEPEPQPKRPRPARPTTAEPASSADRPLTSASAAPSASAPPPPASASASAAAGAPPAGASQPSPSPSAPRAPR